MEALDCIHKAHALAPEDKTVASEMEELEAYISEHIVPQGVGCTFSWGLGGTGGLGHPETKDRTVPTSIAALARRHVVDVSCGAMHTGKRMRYDRKLPSIFTLFFCVCSCRYRYRRCICMG
jgi:hypothetical protein